MVQLPQQVDGRGIEATRRLVARAESAKVSDPLAVQNGFGHNAARRVTAAEEQDVVDLFSRRVVHLTTLPRFAAPCLRLFTIYPRDRSRRFGEFLIAVLCQPGNRAAMTRRLDLGQALALAFAQLDAGRLSEARRLARDLQRVRPDLPGLAYLQGLIALAGDEPRKAAQHLARALAHSPDAPPLLLAMARAQAAQGHSEAAVQIFRRLVGLTPDNAEAWHGLAELLLKERRYEAALEPLRAAARLRPDWALAHNNLGVAERATGRIDLAAAAFARAIDLAPGLAKAHANLAGILRRLKRPDEAVAAAGKAVELAPAEAGHWLELGQAQRDAGDAAAALAALTGAVVRAPRSAEAVWLMGEVLRDMGRVDEAADAFREVLRLDPDDIFGAALVLAQLGEATAPSGAPAGYVRTLFDHYAADYERNLIEQLHYSAPATLASALARTVGSGPFNILDAGCGTGLAGQALRGVAHRLDGVDLSEAMVARAAARNIYDDLSVGDLVATLATRPSRYDLVVAADTLIYLGDLHPVFLASRSALRTDGILAFTVERADGDGYRLQLSKRFAHSPDYLRALSDETGFAVMLLDDASVRSENNQPVPGLIFIGRKV